MTIEHRAIGFERGALGGGFSVDSRAVVPDICREARRTVVDIIRGDQPTTVLGYLLQHREQQLSLKEIAEALSKPLEEVDWTTEVLEKDELCVRFDDGVSVRVMAVAPYSPHNTRLDAHTCHQ